MVSSRITGGLPNLCPFHPLFWTSISSIHAHLSDGFLPFLPSLRGFVQHPGVFSVKPVALKHQRSYIGHPWSLLCTLHFVLSVAFYSVLSPQHLVLSPPRTPKWAKIRQAVVSTIAPTLPSFPRALSSAHPGAKVGEFFKKSLFEIEEI